MVVEASSLVFIEVFVGDLVRAVGCVVWEVAEEGEVFVLLDEVYYVVGEYVSDVSFCF